jgi:hypothetical protein
MPIGSPVEAVLRQDLLAFQQHASYQKEAQRKKKQQETTRLRKKNKKKTTIRI